MKRIGGIPELTTKAKIGAILIAVVIVGAVATFVITSTISNQLAGSKIVAHPDFAKENSANRQKDAMTSSAEAIDSGDDKKADDIYQLALNAETDPTKKVELAINQSKILSLKGKYDLAIAVAKKAESYSDDKYLISDWLGRLYAIAKQYDNAAMYYTAAGSLAESKTNKGGYTKQYYADKVVMMKSLSKNG